MSSPFPVPKVVGYDPNLAELIKEGTPVEIGGLKFKVFEVMDDEIVLHLENGKELLYVLDTGEKITSDEWFNRYIHNLEGYVESTRKNKADSIQEHEGGEGKAKLLPDGDAGEWKDHARSAIAEQTYFDKE